MRRHLLRRLAGNGGSGEPIRHRDRDMTQQRADRIGLLASALDDAVGGFEAALAQDHFLQQFTFEGAALGGPFGINGAGQVAMGGAGQIQPSDTAIVAESYAECFQVLGALRRSQGHRHKKRAVAAHPADVAEFADGGFDSAAEL
jgi:hypothetical protein